MGRVHAGFWRKVAAGAAAFLAMVAPASPAAAQQQAGAQRVTVDSVVVEGNQRVAVESVRSVFGILPGATVSYREIQTGTKALMGTGQFEDVQVRAQDTQADRAVLVVTVAERPLVRRVLIRGLEHADAGAVQDTTGLQPGQPYSPQEVLSARTFIQAELSREGIPFALIEPRTEPVEGLTNVVDLVIDVTEGHRVTIAEVAVRGNERVPEDALIEAMATKPEAFLWFRPGTFDPTLYEQDLEVALPDVYRARGFLDFRVLSDTVVVDPATGKARLEIEVDEGPQYRLAEFTIEGNQEFPDSVLARYFESERRGLLASLGIGGGDEGDAVGQVFDQVAFEAAAEQAGQLYRNEGYLYARVIPQVLRNPAEPGEAATVDVRWQVAEGVPAYVRRVAVMGNDYTYDWVVRDRLFLLPGDRYSEDRLLQSYQSIAGLGFFETPMPAPSLNPDPQTGDVDIVFNVKERQTGSVNFGTSVGGGVGLSGFVGYEQPNLFGQGKSGRLRWDFGRYLNNFELSYSDPALLRSRVSGSISLFNSRNRFFNFASGRYKRLGGEVRFGFPVPGARRTRVFTGYTLARTSYQAFESSDDRSVFGLPDGTQSTFLLGVTRSTVNSPLFPTSGSRQSWNMEVNGGVLGGSADFTKHMLEGAWWVPVGQLGGGGVGARGPVLALGLTLRGGAIFGNASQFPFDRFYMGGVQFGQQLRGYDETSITPFGFFAERAGGIRDVDRLGDAFLSLTAEYALRLSDAISVSTFFDAGNVWRTPQEIDPTHLFRGAGIGLQLVTPFGPIGLDYAYGFDKPQPGWQLHFRMGPGF